jgi:hypothetical protein
MKCCNSNSSSQEEDIPIWDDITDDDMSDCAVDDAEAAAEDRGLKSPESRAD